MVVKDWNLHKISISITITYISWFLQGIDSDIEEVTRPGDNNSDPMLENHLEENGNDLPPIEDITTIPEEASEELREEEEAAALEAALRTPDGGTISTEIEKPSTATIMQEWVQKVPLPLLPLYISLETYLVHFPSLLIFAIDLMIHSRHELESCVNETNERQICTAK